MAVCSNIEAARWFYLEHLWPQDPTELKLPDLKDFICIFLRVGFFFVLIYKSLFLTLS